MSAYISFSGSALPASHNGAADRNLGRHAITVGSQLGSFDSESHGAMYYGWPRCLTTRRYS